MKTSNVCQEAAGLLLTREALAKTRRKALRQRCWYKALNRLERGIVDLAIRCVEKVKSTNLRTTLMEILAKLVQAFRPGYLDMVESVGVTLAAQTSQLAQLWGNTRAAKWKNDTALIRYLGANSLSQNGWVGRTTR